MVGRMITYLRFFMCNSCAVWRYKLPSRRSKGQAADPWTAALGLLIHIILAGVLYPWGWTWRLGHHITLYLNCIRMISVLIAQLLKVWWPNDPRHDKSTATETSEVDVLRTGTLRLVIHQGKWTEFNLRPHDGGGRVAHFAEFYLQKMYTTFTGTFPSIG